MAAALTILLYLGCAAGPPPEPVREAPRTGHARGQRPYEINGIYYYPIPSAQGFVEEGIASWYGRDFHGKPTANGETYDMYAMTAAHKTLPLGTHVKVERPDNGRSIVVRINDRGPFVKGRIIDLSRTGAQRLDMLRAGTARVRVEAVRVASEKTTDGETQWETEPLRDFRRGTFTVQVGAYRTHDNAGAARDSVEQFNDEVRIKLFSLHGSSFYRVQVGTYGDLIEAHLVAAQLRDQGFGGAMVVAMEE